MDVNEGVDETATVGFCAVPPVVMLLPAPTLCTYVVAVERNWLVDALDKNKRDTSVAPEKSVVPLKLAATTEVNEGVELTATEGLCAVPPVTMFVPALMFRTYVAPVERNTFDRLVPPDVKVLAATDVKEGVDDTATVGFCAVPPVTTFVPAPTLCT